MNKLEEFEKTHEQLTKKIKRKYKKEDKKLEDDIFRKISVILSENPDGKSCMKVLNSTDVDNIIKFNIYIRLYDVNSIDGEDIWNHMRMLVEQSFHKKYESFDLVEKLKMAEYLFLNNDYSFVELSDSLLKSKYHLDHLLWETLQDIISNLKKQLEIEKKAMEDQLQIQKLATELKKNSNNSAEITKYPEFTTTRQVLALKYLLKYVNAKDVIPGARKKFIHFLISKDMSAIYKKFNDDCLAYNKDGKDLSFVRELYKNLGLTEIVRMIDNDTP